MRSTTTRRFAALVAGMSLVLGAHVLVGGQIAAAIPNLQKVAASSPTDSASPKTVEAVCPAGTRVIGGGGWAFATALADERKVQLTGLEPRTTTSRSSYIVTGEEIAPGMAGNWWLEAYALCASTPAGYEIVSASTAPSSAGTQQTASLCTGSKRVFGTGARIDNSGGQVTLQLTRADITPRRIGRVTAKEDANGYSGTWNVTSFAVCANDLPGFIHEANGTPTNSDDTKLASVTCPAGTFVHSTSVASSGTPPGLNTTPPGVAVQVLYPSNDLRSAQVFAVETTPTSVNWDVGIFVICGP